MTDFKTQQPDTANGEKPKRRPRYQGTHPRRFHEKYKELHPDRYPDEIEKAKASGKTPAGSHRAICMTEILEILKPRPGQRVVDATLGYGDHSSELLKRITPGGKLFGFDVDAQELPKTEARLRAAGFSAENFIACQKNFSEIPETLNSLGCKKVHLVLADLGLSSMQLDNPDRGFSFKTEGPLDLRMNPLSGVPASQFLRSLSKQQLVKILEENSDEIFAEEITEVIFKTQHLRAIETTAALTRVILSALEKLPRRIQEEQGNTPIRRVFQALRIAINDEFRSLEIFLENLPEILLPGGKVAVLTFHSGEDRRVKKAFQAGLRSGLFSDVARDVIRPNYDEIRSNPRASSAKLRWAIRA